MADGLAQLAAAVRMPTTAAATATTAATASPRPELRRCVLLNYHMSTAGQRPFGGHFSPLAAFHAPSGRFLVLDVWPQTAPCWVSGELLWAALVGTDSDSGRSRGWAVAGRTHCAEGS